MRRLFAAVCCAVCAFPAFAADQTTYAEGSRPQILVNWGSFEEQGFPPDWKIPFQNVVINAYTRINRVGGIDVRPQFAGYTTKTDSDPGEIVISCNEKHANSSRLASAFGSLPDRIKIVFHRKRGSDLTVWNYTPFWPNHGEYSMYGVLMHELQHALGLDHSAPSKSIMGGYTWQSHHGPFSGDLTDLRALYEYRQENKLRQLASYNGGGSWSTQSNDITGYGGMWGSTTNRIAAAGNASNGRYIVGWAAPDNRLTWVPGDGVQFDTDGWQAYSELPRPRYGSDMVSDNGNNWMWVVVDGDADANRIRVIRSQDDGGSWSYTGFPYVKTAATPAIASTRVNGQRAWVVMWTNWDESDRDATGFLNASVSMNNGVTWSAPHVVNGFYRVHEGVGLAADDEGHLTAAFVWAGEKGDWEYGQNKVRMIRCRVSNAGQVIAGRICFTNEHSRVAPDLTWHADTQRFAVTLREQNYHTSIMTGSAAADACPPSLKHVSGTTTHVAPGMARNPAWSTSAGNEIVLWLARE